MAAIRNSNPGPIAAPEALPPECLAQLSSEAMNRFPEECCGLLLGVAHGADEIAVQKLVALPNTFAGDRTRNFQMDADAVRSAGRAHAPWLEVVGFFHSHPAGSAAPSEADLAMASAWRGYLHAIVATTARGEAAEVRLYRINETHWREIASQEVS